MVNLISTKLEMPSLRPGLVARPGLVKRLDESLTVGCKLALLAAPAGYGKTTLTLEWLQSLDQALPPKTIAWLSLDEGDNDPARFTTYLLASLQKVDASIGEGAQAIMASPQPPPPEVWLTSLVNDLAAFRGQTVSRYDALIDRTATEARTGAQIVVWEENAAIGAQEDLDALIERGRQVAKQEGIYLVMGLLLWEQELTEPRAMVIDPAGEVVINHLKHAIPSCSPSSTLPTAFPILTQMPPARNPHTTRRSRTRCI